MELDKGNYLHDRRKKGCLQLLNVEQVSNVELLIKNVKVFFMVRDCLWYETLAFLQNILHHKVLVTKFDNNYL